MEELERITVRGSQGEWWVFVPGYGDVGIVPDLFKDGDKYSNRRLTPSRGPKANKLADLIREKNLVVTADIVFDGDPDDLSTKTHRNEYGRLYRVHEFEFDEAGLRFHFGKELADVGKKSKWQEKHKRARRGRGSY
jgi:hypothetical protein